LTLEEWPSRNRNLVHSCILYSPVSEFQILIEPFSWPDTIVFNEAAIQKISDIIVISTIKF
jgi:hypothetical protein